MQINTRKLQLIFLFALILLAVFFRFWQIRDYVIFLGDEGRDMIVMRKMIIDKRPTFLGPTASVGGFYLGPIYYWMAAPFLALWRFDPVGPAYLVAAIGVATIFLLYKFLKEAVGFWPAIFAGSLYATAPLIIRYSRSSWNPNPLPFFALLLVYFMYKGIKTQKLVFFFLAGAAFGIAIQLHYLAVIMVPVSILIVVLTSNYRIWIKIAFLATAGLLITFSPFLLFEIKNGLPNFKTIAEFVTRPSTHGFRTINFLWLISSLGNILLEEITKLKGTIYTQMAFWGLALGGLYAVIRGWTDKSKRLIALIALIWFLGGLFFLRYYSGQIFDYYFGFMFPAPFVLAGVLFSFLWSKSIFRPVVILLTVASLVWFVSNGFYKNPPNKLLDQTAKVAEFVIEKSRGDPFNFALISDSNSDHAYRYFLEIRGYKPVELETLVTNQLLVVCESKKCAPLGHPIWEIAGFGRGEIAEEWELPNIGIRIFRVTHWPGVPNPAGRPAVKGG